MERCNFIYFRFAYNMAFIQFVYFQYLFNKRVRQLSILPDRFNIKGYQEACKTQVLRAFCVFGGVVYVNRYQCF